MQFNGNAMGHLERVVVEVENIDQTKIKIPKGHKLMEVHYKDSIPKYLITTNLIRDKYYLYRIVNDCALEKLETSNIPKFKRRTI